MQTVHAKKVKLLDRELPGSDPSQRGSEKEFCSVSVDKLIQVSAECGVYSLVHSLVLFLFWWTDGLSVVICPITSETEACVADTPTYLPPSHIIPALEDEPSPNNPDAAERLSLSGLPTELIYLP